MLLPSSRSADPELLEARETTERVARTFALACRLLPREVRDDVHLLYLVFRTLDDLVDDARHRLPRWAMADFCAGMRDDLTGTPVLTEADLERYCYRVAGTVGITMTALLGVRPGVAEADAHAAASALGCAMQRTNILRDIDEDLAIGRVYLPAEALAPFGGTVPAPADREPLLRDQIARADARYEEGLAGVRFLAGGRVAIRAAAAMYREILRQLEREDYGARAQRAVVPTRRKLAVAARAGVGAA